MGYRNWIIENGERQEDYTLIRLGTTYFTVRIFLKKVGARFEIKGFGDLTAEEISRLTGLSPERVEMAKAREFTEPFILKRPESIGCLSALAAEKDLKVTRGGRFHHLIGEQPETVYTPLLRLSPGARAVSKSVCVSAGLYARAHVRKTRPQAIVILAHQRVPTRKVDVIS